MFLLYRVLFCNFANSSQICKTFLGLISCKCCTIVFFLSLLYVVFIFPPCKCKYCHKKCCNQIKKNSPQPVREGAPTMLSLLYEKNGGNFNAGR